MTNFYVQHEQKCTALEEGVGVGVFVCFLFLMSQQKLELCTDLWLNVDWNDLILSSSAPLSLTMFL
jgi:hypothetical protein